MSYASFYLPPQPCLSKRLLSSKAYQWNCFRLHTIIWIIDNGGEDGMPTKTKENILFLAWAVSVIATVGSLYFSEIKQFEPCTLCWYQRILMYPFTIYLSIAYIRKDFKISLYSMIVSGIGILISSYHYALQKLPFLEQTTLGCGRIPCNGEYINWLGFVTIPFLALTAFIIIFICSLILWRNSRED